MAASCSTLGGGRLAVWTSGGSVCIGCGGCGCCERG